MPGCKQTVLTNCLDSSSAYYTFEHQRDRSDRLIAPAVSTDGVKEKEEEKGKYE